MHPARAYLQENCQLVIDRDKPEPEALRVLPGEAVGEARGGRYLKVIQDDNGTDGRLIKREKQGVLTLRGVGRTVDENELRPLQPKQRLTLRRDIKRLNESNPVPTSSERYDFGKIGFALRDRVGLFFGSPQPIGRILDGGSCRGCAAQRVG